MTTDKLQALHEALTDVFSESPLTSTDTEASSPFDHEAISEIFSGPHPLSASTGPSSAIDHVALAGIFSERVPTSTSTRSSPPGFDHHALAGVLSEAPPTSTNARPSPPGFDHQALAKILSEPLPTPADMRTSPPSFDQQSLETLSELHPVPFNPRLSPRSFDSGSSSATFSGPRENKEPAARTAAITPSTNAESAQPQQAKSLLAKLHHILSAKAEPPPFSGENAPSTTPVSGRLQMPEPAASGVAATSDAGIAGARPPPATSLAAEPCSLISINTEASPPISEKKSLRPTVAARLHNVDPGARAVAVAAPAGVENAREQPARSLPVEPVPPILADVVPSPRAFGKEPLRQVLSGRPCDVEPADKADVKVRSPDLANTAPQPPVSANGPAPISLPGRPDHTAPAVKTAAAVPPIHPVAIQPQQTKLLPLIDPPAMSSTTPRPAVPIFEEDSPPPSLSGQQDNVEPAANAVADAAADHMESAVTRAQQTKALLAEMDIDTAIRLRWVMRDIRSKRTKLSPVSGNDLTALMDLGLVELREELPRLTALGVLALD